MYRNLTPFKIAVLAVLALLAGAAAAFAPPEALLSIAPLAAADWQTLNKAMDQLEVKLASLPELADRVLQLEQRRGGAGILPDGETTRTTFGALAVEQIEKHADLLAKTRSLRLSIKAATDPLATTGVRNIVSGGIGAPTGGVLGFHNALPRRPTDATAVEYSRYTGLQGAAAQQATEGTTKAAVRPDHTLITQSALTIAGYTKVSRQALADRAELTSVLDVVLRRSVETALDVALVNGATGFTGGYEALATAATSATYSDLVDAISEGVSVMQTAGFAPDVVALTPADWLAIVVAKGTANDHYLSGSYLGKMPMEMRALRVVLSPSVDSGKALLIDSSHTELLMRQEFDVEMAYDADDFTKNLITVLGETRVIPIFRSVGAARLITPSA